jgi:hypothetical protein
MSHFQTDDILNCWHEKLSKRFGDSCSRIEREYTYIKKQLPFKALSMGKKNDEYFLDASNKRISTRNLLEDLNLLVVKEFRDIQDLSLDDKQAQVAKSIADIYVDFEFVEIIIELEVFKDKPFSNLIYVPEVCSRDKMKPLYFIHCFAPERHDDEAEVTRRIGYWLESQPSVERYEYSSYVLPTPSDSIKYLLPNKRATKPKLYRCNEDRVTLNLYAATFCEDVIIPKINTILTSLQ